MSYDISWVLTNSNNFTSLGGDNISVYGTSYGYSNSLNSNGNILAIGSPVAPYNMIDYGIVSTYKYNDISWVKLGQDLKGDEETTNGNDNFGWSICLDGSGSTLVISEPSLDISGLSDVGAIKIYNYNDSTDNWDINSTFYGDEENDHLGTRVIINKNGDTIITSGLNTDTKTLYIQTFKLIDSSWEKTHKYDIYTSTHSYFDSISKTQFVISLDINDSGNIFILGSSIYTDSITNQGFVQLYYSDNDNSWNQLSTNLLGTVEYQLFGYNVAIDKNASFDELYFVVSQSSLIDNIIKTYRIGDGDTNSVLNSNINDSYYDSITVDTRFIPEVGSGVLNISLSSTNILAIGNGEYVDGSYNGLAITYKLNNLSWEQNAETIINYDNYANFYDIEISNDGSTIIDRKRLYSDLTASHIYNASFFISAYKSSNITNTASASTYGDPHINTINGEMYELPQYPGIYRMLQGNNLTINASTNYLSTKEKNEIIHYFNDRNLFNNNNMNIKISDVIVNGVFYEKIFIESEGNSLTFNFKDKTVYVNSKKTLKYFDFKTNIQKNSELYKDKYQCSETITQCSLFFHHTYYGSIRLDLNYFSNPQIKYGIGLTIERNKNLSGLLTKELNITSMKVKNITDTKKKIEKKGKNKVISKMLILN
jgi:hypothetical protein